MERLDQAALRSRLAFDWKVLRDMRSAHLGLVRPYASAVEARANRVLSDRDAEAGLATCYSVEYRLRIPTALGQFVPSTFAWFDLLAGGNYPFTAPAVTCVSQPLPWSPHVNPGSGIVCLGDAWPRANGRMLSAQLVAHIMRLLNWDEPDRGAHYVGWSPSASKYWREVLQGRPISPELEYPVLPAELTHGVETEDAGFRAVGSFEARSDGFKAVGSSR